MLGSGVKVRDLVLELKRRQQPPQVRSHLAARVAIGALEVDGHTRVCDDDIQRDLSKRLPGVTQGGWGTLASGGDELDFEALIARQSI